MAFISILPSYISWHYSEALSGFLKIWTNFIWFLYNFFSIPVLFKTLFAPFKRLQEEKKSLGFDFSEWAQNFILNTFMRFVGALLRLIIISIGCFFVIVSFWLGVISFIIWISMPAILAVLVFFGFSLIIL